ncbi:queuosine precursor transporter [Parvularcula lutaonensis]|uniref:Probable queuosine precursor transporter n=1 Tax=Parvularcula lutaonensis TaxID=491923 RepID=A0ABV7MEI1_9PROT|nr:queuosine precursor transporter [Parvularcula lutaonensis]GGY39735.1 transporter [Parvularcula lutaonensis]
MAEALRNISGEEASARHFKYFDLLLAATCVIVVCSNIIGAGKVADIGGFAFGAGVLFFPLSYVLGDVLTEVYGYKRARRAIRAATAAALFAAVMAGIITLMPPAPGWNADIGGIDRQSAFEANFGQAPRIVAASLLALYFGEIANARVMAVMKVRMKGSRLWQRTIGSTIVGQGVDSLIFYPLAFLGVWTLELVLTVMVTNYALKVAWEALLTPVTYKVVNALKRSEGVDVYDAPGADI